MRRQMISGAGVREGGSGLEAQRAPVRVRVGEARGGRKAAERPGGLHKGRAAALARRGPDPAQLQLLVQLLGEDAPDVWTRATCVLVECDGAAGLAAATRSQLVAAGLTDPEAERVRAAMGLAMTAAACAPMHGRLDRDAAIAMWRPVFSPLAHEELHAMFLTRDGLYLGRQRLARGGLATVSVYLRDVLVPALEAGAELLVVAHNHPSGSCEPSADDYHLTRRLAEASSLLGIRLVDHLVFSLDGVASATEAKPRWPAAGPVRRRDVESE